MKTKMILLTLALGASTCLVTAQNGNPSRDVQRSPMNERLNRGQGGPAMPDPMQPLTVAQKQQVGAILSKYKANALNADQAKAIHEAFRQAGLRGGPAMTEAIREAGFDPEKLRDLAPPPDQGRDASMNPPPQGNNRGNNDRPGVQGKGGQGQYSIEQAISDRAQLNTIAFDGLAFLTGDMGSCTFLPPGKAADFFGFQYMRDVDKNELGHNTSFVPRAANNVLYVLSSEQKNQLVNLAKEQEKLLAELAYKRFPLIKAFCRQLAGDIPSGTQALDREAVMKYTAGIFEIDGLLSYQRASVLGGIVRSLTDAQKSYLGKLAFNNSSTWPELEDQVDKRSLPRAVHVAVMTYASEMFSWYAGSVDADVYFCPERHATYFGSFYMKDIPAMGNANFSISTSLTGDSGEAFLAALSKPQYRLVESLLDLQKKDLDEIVAVRRAISEELRRFMKEGTADKEKVLSLAKRYGELDGEISYYYAMHFSEVAKTLTADQKTTLLKLRNLDSKYTCKGAYLYSQAIDMPEIQNTDFLFGNSSSSKSTAESVISSPDPSESTFSLKSPVLSNGGRLPQDFTGDGLGVTPPLEWTTPPNGTQGFAVIMHHIDPEGKTKWYWTLFNIPAEVRSLPRNVQNVGISGNNSVNEKVGYAPPHSKGPGDKTYILTLYALSAPLRISIPPAQITRDTLLAAMKDKILASSELQVIYARSGTGPDDNNRKDVTMNRNPVKR